MRAFVTCDGEAKQIEEFEKEPCLSYFRNAHVDLGKTPASCSAICQASDVSPFFKSAKKVLRGIDIERKAYIDDVIETRLKEIFQTRSGDFRHKARYIDGIQRVLTAVKDVSKPSTIKKGFIDCGQWPLDLNKAIKLSKYPFSDADKSILQQKLPDMVNLYRNKGEATEADMDSLVIPKTDLKSKIPKDLRVLHRQRAVILNKEDVVMRFTAEKLKKLQAKTTPKAKPKEMETINKPLKQQVQTLFIVFQLRNPRDPPEGLFHLLLTMLSLRIV
jgi:hypothetical protein